MDTSHITISAEDLQEIMTEQDGSKKKEGARRLFNMVDRDSDGTCDKTEIKCLMFYMAKMQGEEVTDEGIEEAMAENFSQLDKDGSGSVDFEEFFNALF